jgi:cytochrome P450
VARVFPGVGDAFSFRADKLGFMVRAARRGGVVGLELGRTPTYLLTEPADIRHVLVTEEPRFPKNPRLLDVAERRLFGQGLVAAPEEAHRAMRLSLQPAFDHRQLAPLGDVIDASAHELFDEWAERDEIDLADATFMLAHDVRRRVLLGDEGDGIGSELAAALEARQRYINQAFVSPLPFSDRLPSPARRAYRRAQAELERLLFPLIRSHRRDDTLLGHLLALQLGEQRVFDEARGFLASYELSARALAWTLLLLTQHTDVQDRLRDEPDVMGYPQLVYSEALRLYPPTWLFVRMAPAAARLPSGATVPAGSRLFLCPYASHRDPRHFPDPDRFDPARERPRSAYFPFGGGRHVCIGEGFVRLEAALVLACLSRDFEVERAGDGQAQAFPGATLELRGDVRVRVKRRAPSGPSVSIPQT